MTVNMNTYTSTNTKHTYTQKEDVKLCTAFKDQIVWSWTLNVFPKVILCRPNHLHTLLLIIDKDLPLILHLIGYFISLKKEFYIKDIQTNWHSLKLRISKDNHVRISVSINTGLMQWFEGEKKGSVSKTVQEISHGRVTVQTIH